MNDGYALAFGSIYQGGRAYDGSNDVMAVFKSTNDGDSWSRYYLSTVLGDVYSLAVYPASPDIVFAGGRRQTGSNYETALFQSTNGGSTWNDLSASFTGSRMNIIRIDPNDTDRILAGCNDGVWVSTNGGIDWSSPTSFFNVEDITDNPNTTDEWYIGTSTGVYQSLDGGFNWTQFNKGLNNTYIQCIALDAANQILYAGTNGGGICRFFITSGVEEIEDLFIPENLTLHQNYPNPFNMQTEIVYDLRIDGTVNLSIYNGQGRLIRILVDCRQTSGRKTVTWDSMDENGKEVSSGIYICNLKTDDSADMKKMILQK